MFQDVREVNGIELRLAGKDNSGNEIWIVEANDLVRPDLVEPGLKGRLVYFWKLEHRGFTWSTEVAGVVHPYTEVGGKKFWHQLCDTLQHARSVHDDFFVLMTEQGVQR